LLMAQVDFRIQIQSDQAPGGEYLREERRLRLGQRGYDQVEFLFSPNPGEEAKPLAKIASGGELSRVLQALKSIISGKTGGLCLIFDEIDSGIGGKSASKVGQTLQKLARDNQVLVITHLQQIAACGEHHFLVYKEESEGRMKTHIRKLTIKQRQEEIGRMISGEKISPLSLRQAEELLQNKKQ